MLTVLQKKSTADEINQQKAARTADQSTVKGRACRGHHLKDAALHIIIKGLHQNRQPVAANNGKHRTDDVKAVCELMPYSGGLARNIEQCLNDFDIPLLLSHTVVDIHGKERLSAVTIAKVDEGRRPIPGTETTIPCDTLLLSCGLIPENELTKASGIELDRITGGARVDGDRETDIPGIFACGNVLHVHDLVDYVSEESVIAGEAAVRYINGEKSHGMALKLVTDGKIRYTVPQRISSAEKTKVYFRVSNVYRDVKITVKAGDRVLLEKKKQKVAPGEMETVILTPDMLSSCDKDETLAFSLEDIKK